VPPRCPDLQTAPPGNSARAVGPRPRRCSFPEACARLRGRAVLVVDADVENAGRAFVSLTQAGAEVRLVRRSAQIATAIAERRPELVLVGTRNPDEPAETVVAELRTRLGETVVIGALTPGKNPKERTRLLAGGCHLVLVKPVDVYLFAQTLAGALLGLGTEADGR